jgi:hypothetical protein
MPCLHEEDTIIHDDDCCCDRDPAELVAIFIVRLGIYVLTTLWTKLNQCKRYSIRY